MNKYFKPSLRLFGQIVIATVLDFIIVLSMVMIFNGFFTHTTGYHAAVVDEKGTAICDTDGKPIEYTYLKSSGKDVKKAEYEKQGYKITTVSTRSELAGKSLAGFYIVTQVFTIMLLSAFVYPRMWDIGAKDSNAVHFGRKSEDKLYGLKIGALAMIPNVIIWAVLMIAGGKLPISIYALSNAGLYSLIMAVSGGIVKIAALSFGKKLLVLLLSVIIPALAELAYYLGYKDISISEKLIYKNKKKGER